MIKKSHGRPTSRTHHRPIRPLHGPPPMAEDASALTPLNVIRTEN